MSSRVLSKAPSLFPCLTHAPPRRHQYVLRRAISTISPGDIYSQIDSNFVHFFLTPQCRGKRKNLVLATQKDRIQFVPLSHPGDPPSLLSSITVPANTKTGLETPHTVIGQHIFELPVTQFEKGKKQGSAPTCLEDIQKIQQTMKVYFWSRTLPYEDYCRQLYQFNRAYPDYHYPLESEENVSPPSSSSISPSYHWMPTPFSTLSGGDIYSHIDSEFSHFPLTPQHEGKRKKLILSQEQDYIRFVPLSHPGDPPSLLLGSVTIPANAETGIPTALQAIVQQVFEIPSHTLKTAKKHGSAPACLKDIHKAQEDKKVYFWSHTSMRGKDYYKQFDTVKRAHPEYHLVERVHNLVGKTHQLVWDQAAVQHAAQQLHKNVPPYLVGAPRMYLLDEPWGKEVWDGIKKNIKRLQQNQGRFRVELNTQKQMRPPHKNEEKISTTPEDTYTTKKPPC